MRLKHNAWIFDNALNKHTCDELIRIGNEQIIEEATVDGGTKPAKTLRVCETGWIHDPYIMQQIMEYVATANVNAEWNFDYDTPELIQFTKYNVGGHYTWHRDTNTDISKTGGATRKLSVTINLNDDYEGGDMWFDNALEYDKTDPKKISKSTGGITVFPSHVWHKVDKVTKGTRYSLVFWFKGNEFV